MKRFHLRRRQRERARHVRRLRPRGIANVEPSNSRLAEYRGITWKWTCGIHHHQREVVDLLVSRTPSATRARGPPSRRRAPSTPPPKPRRANVASSLQASTRLPSVGCAGRSSTTQLRVFAQQRRRISELRDGRVHGSHSSVSRGTLSAPPKWRKVRRLMAQASPPRLARRRTRPLPWLALALVPRPRGRRTVRRNPKRPPRRQRRAFPLEAFFRPPVDRQAGALTRRPSPGRDCRHLRAGAARDHRPRRARPRQSDSRFRRRQRRESRVGERRAPRVRCARGANEHRPLARARPVGGQT